MVDPDPPPSTPSPTPTPPASRAIAMFAIVFVVLGLLAFASWSVVRPAASAKYCTADARIGPDGTTTYGRDIDQDCRFVDADGNVLPDQ